MQIDSNVSLHFHNSSCLDKTAGGVDGLFGGHHSPIQGPSRALRWRSGHRSDQSPSRGQTPQNNIQPVTCLLRMRLPSSEAYPARAYSFIPSPFTFDWSSHFEDGLRFQNA